MSEININHLPTVLPDGTSFAVCVVNGGLVRVPLSGTDALAIVQAARDAETAKSQTQSMLANFSVETCPDETEIEWTAPSVFVRTCKKYKLTASRDVSFAPPTMGNGAYTFELRVIMGATLSSITWSSLITWADGSVPTLEAGKSTVFAFTTYDGGLSWIGNKAFQF